jgi:hypothetical protein
LARIGVAAVAMAAAEEDALSDASVETVEQHPDRRSEPDEGGDEDMDSDVGSQDEFGGSDPGSEHDTDDDASEDTVTVTRAVCGESGGTLTVVSVALPKSGGAKASAKRHKYGT